MSTTPEVYHDERTVTVENAGYRWAYLFLSFGLLVLVAYRSFFHGESAWDLLGLVILGGVVGTVYQAFHRVLSRPWAVATLLALVTAAGVAALLTWLRG